MSTITPCLWFDSEAEDAARFYTGKLTAGGDARAQQCGWLKDRYGLSWQVFPAALMDMLRDQDRKKADRAMQAMMQMRKMDLAGLERAYSG